MRFVVFLSFFTSLILLLLSGCETFGGKGKVDVSLTFNVSDAKSVFVLNEYTGETDAKFVSSQLYGLSKVDDALYLAQTEDTDLPFLFTATDPNANYLYIAVDLSYFNTSNPLFRLLEKENCSVFKVSLSDNASSCALKNIAVDQYLDSQWSVLNNSVKPVQFDEQGGVYILGRAFTVECRSYSSTEKYRNGDKVCENSQQRIAYQNFSAIYYISADGSTEVIEKTDEAIASFVTFPAGELAYLSKNLAENSETLHVKLQSETIEVNNRLGSVSNYAVLNQETLLWNNTQIFTWRDSLVQRASIDTGLVPDGDIVMDNGRVYSAADGLLFQRLPPQVKAESLFERVNNISPLVADGYAITLRKIIENNKTQHHIIFRSLDNTSEVIFLEDENWLLNRWRIIDGELIFSALDQESNIIVIGIILLSGISEELSADSLKLITVIKRDGKSFDVIDFESTRNIAPISKSTAPYVKGVYMFAKNRISVSLEFDQKMDASSVLSNLQLQDANAEDVNYLPIWVDNTLHLIVDEDGFSNNSLVLQEQEFKLINQLPMLPLEEYTLSINGSAISASGKSLGEFDDLQNFPLGKSFSTIADGETYLDSVESVNRELTVISSRLAEGSVLALAPCLNGCGDIRYNLGTEKQRNIRHEFSLSSGEFELMLWNKTRYSSSYNFSYSRDLQFYFNKHSITVTAGDQNSQYDLSADELNQWLSRDNVWRRYRIDIYDRNIQVSYSTDGSSYTTLPALSLSNIPTVNLSMDEYNWLLSFSGAIDQWQSSSLTENNNLLNVAGDVMSEVFDDDNIISTDTGVDDGIGFDDNIGESYPVTKGPGSPDDTFGLQGGAYFGGVADWFGDASAMAVDSDGRVLLAAKVRNSLNDDMAIWRITPDGMLDTTFGTGGVIVHDNAAGGNYHDSAEAVVVDATGKTYVAGSSHNGVDDDLVLWRITENGQLDTTFNGQGYVVYNSATKDAAYAMTIDQLGRIIIAGVSDNKPTVWVYRNNGELETTFNSTGFLRYGDTQGKAVSVASDADNNIFVTGEMDNSGGDVDMLLLKINELGNIVFEKLFDGVGGNVGNDTYGASIALDDSQRIIVFGYEFVVNNHDLIVWRINSMGELDTSFADESETPGRISYDSGEGDLAYAMALGANGNINLLASGVNQANGFYVIRYSADTKDGMIDDSFDKNGILRRNGYSGKIITTLVNGVDKIYASGMQVIADGFDGERAVWRINSN